MMFGRSTTASEYLMLTHNDTSQNVKVLTFLVETRDYNNN